MADERGPKPKSTELQRKSQKGAPVNDEQARAMAQFAEEATKQYGRGDKIRPKSVKDKKLRSNLRLLENKNKQAVLEAKNVDPLLTARCLDGGR